MEMQRKDPQMAGGAIRDLFASCSPRWDARSFRPRRRGLVLTLLAALPVVLVLGGKCSIAAGAEEEILPASVASPGACRDGFRRQSLLRDYALRRQWIVFASCLHPEIPRIAVADASAAPPGSDEPAPQRRDPEPRSGTDAHRSVLKASPPLPALVGAGPPVTAAMPVVQAGSRVRLWRRDGIVQIDLAGMALASGGPGAAIPVRLATGGKVLRGTVREAGSVELDPRSGRGFRETQ